MYARIEKKRELLEVLQTKAERSTVSFDGMPKAAANPHARENSVVSVADLSSDIERDIVQMLDLQHDIGNAIAAVQDSKLQSILELRYLAFLPWKKVADVFGYSVSSTIRLHGDALKEVTVPEKYQHAETV